MPRSRPPATRERPRLIQRARGERIELWTEASGEPPAVYGERWTEIEGHPVRAFDPARSKLAAGIVKGWRGGIPTPRQRWLYLGAASGTTASHVADLVGPGGAVYGVEKSVRPFARLLRLSDRWPTLRPILADARAAEEYVDLVPPVEGLYVDIAQPDQVAIALANARVFLRGPGGEFVLALKTASLGRDRSAAAHLALAEAELDRYLDLAPSVRLDPFHRGHYLVGGRARPTLFREEARAPITPRPGRSLGPRGR